MYQVLYIEFPSRHSAPGHKSDMDMLPRRERRNLDFSTASSRPAPVLALPLQMPFSDALLVPKQEELNIANILDMINNEEQSEGIDSFGCLPYGIGSALVCGGGAPYEDYVPGKPEAAPEAAQTTSHESPHKPRVDRESEHTPVKSEHRPVQSPQQQISSAFGIGVAAGIAHLGGPLINKLNILESSMDRNTNVARAGFLEARRSHGVIGQKLDSQGVRLTDIGADVKSGNAMLETAITSISTIEEQQKRQISENDERELTMLTDKQEKLADRQKKLMERTKQRTLETDLKSAERSREDAKHTALLEAIQTGPSGTPSAVMPAVMCTSSAPPATGAPTAVELNQQQQVAQSDVVSVASEQIKKHTERLALSVAASKARTAPEVSHPKPRHLFTLTPSKHSPPSLTICCLCVPADPQAQHQAQVSHREHDPKLPTSSGSATENMTYEIPSV